MGTPVEEPAIVVSHRERLAYLLSEAAEIEHCTHAHIGFAADS